MENIRDQNGDAVPEKVCGIAHRLKVMAIEGVHVLAVRRGGKENLGVAGPTESLVPLGAVGWESEEIGVHPPRDVAV